MRACTTPLGVLPSMGSQLESSPTIVLIVGTFLQSPLRYAATQNAVQTASPPPYILKLLLAWVSLTYKVNSQHISPALADKLHEMRLCILVIQPEGKPCTEKLH